MVGLFTVPSLTRKTSVLEMLGVGERNWKNQKRSMHLRPSVRWGKWEAALH